jgi:hypothetical protein
MPGAPSQVAHEAIVGGPDGLRQRSEADLTLRASAVTTCLGESACAAELVPKNGLG